MRLLHFIFGSFIVKLMLDRKLGGRSRVYVTLRLKAFIVADFDKRECLQADNEADHRQ